MRDDFGLLFLHMVCGFCKLVPFHDSLQNHILQRMEQSFKKPPAQFTPGSTLFAPHYAEVCKAFSLGEEGDSEIGLPRDD